MARGIDIYRYQRVVDWNAVKNSGVSFVYVKGSDGGTPAQVRADSQVRGAQGVGIPVGLYHYAQLSPSPEAQADVLAGEVRRLNAAGLPPALDLEDPHVPSGAAADFTRRFLRRLRQHWGFDRVTLYANTSMLTGIRADDIRAQLAGDGLTVVIWAARYGSNNGQNQGLGGYGGWVDIHQFTSKGRVPGIVNPDSGGPQDVDLNDSADLAWIGGEDDMTPEELLNHEIVWWNGKKASIKDILAGVHIASSGLMGNAAFPGETVAPALPPLAGIAAAVAGLTDDESKVLAAVAGARGDVMMAVANVLAGLDSVDGKPSDEQMAEMTAALNAGLGGAYNVTITKAPEPPPAGE